MVKIRNCALYSSSPAEKRIQIFEKAISLLNLVYDEGDYGFSHYHLCELNIWIANRYIEMKDYAKASEYLERGLCHGKLYDELPAETEHTSFLVMGHKFKTDEVYSSYRSNHVKYELDYIDSSEFYNGVREMDWFTSIIEKYRQFAKDEKQIHT